MEASLAQPGVRLIALGKSRRWDVIGPLWRLWRIFRNERADVVYSFLPAQTVLSALLVPWQTRLVFGIRSSWVNIEEYDALSAFIYRFEALISRRANLIVTNSYAGRTDAIARGMPGGRVTAVPNGIDTEFMRPDPAAGRALRRMWNVSETAFVVGQVARLDPMKDYENFLAAAASFTRDHSDAIFVCVGDGSEEYRKHLLHHARELGIADRIRWTGELVDVRSAYNAFDIATLSSRIEGFPNVIGEAMACGIPVVATDVGDTALIIGNHGETVPPERPDLLSAGWSRLRHRLTLEPGLRMAARNCIVANYSVDAMVDRTEKLFTALCNSVTEI